MASVVILGADRVEIPSLNLDYGINPPLPKLQEGLEAFQVLKEDIALQILPAGQRREAAHFLRQMGRLLFQTLFPRNGYPHLPRRSPLLLQLTPEWAAYPWELLDDGTGQVALERGVVRYLAPPAGVAPEPPPEPLRVLALAADPFPDSHPANLHDLRTRAGTRFVSVVSHLLDPAETAVCLFRPEPHAPREAVEGGLALHPHLMLFSGFAGPEGWYVETRRGTADCLPPAWLAEHLRQAVRNGLQAFLVNDSLGLLDPSAAAVQTRALLAGGVPGVIRTAGHLARTREQDYLRTLVHHLAAGEGLPAGHLAAVRRLHRRHRDGWDWSFIQLHLRGLPISLERPPRPRSLAARAIRPVAQGFRLALPPPIFLPRRRVFGREAVLSRLIAALDGETQPPSPLLFLTGPAGCGKTVMALELAQRTHRRFGQIVYLHARELLNDEEHPPPGEILTPTQSLLSLLVRHLGTFALLKQPPAHWRAALAETLAPLAPALIVVDRLEHHPGYYGFCEFLGQLPAGWRALVLSRGKPPLLNGSWMNVPPAEPAELAHIFGDELLERLGEHQRGQELADLCGRDLLLARMLRRQERWPGGPAGDTENLPPDDPRLARGWLEALVPLLLHALSDDAVEVLAHLALFTHLVASDLPAKLLSQDGPRFHRALAELQWLGMVDAYDGTRFLAVPPRLQGPLAERLVTRGRWARACPAVVRAYRAYLAQAGRDLHERPELLAHGWPAMLAWMPGEATSLPGAERLVQRLGVERINLAELGRMLAESGAPDHLEQLAAAAEAANGLPQWEDVTLHVNTLLLAQSRAEGHSAAEARALVRLAAPLLAKGQPEPARELLENALRLLGAEPDWGLLEEIYLSLSRCCEALGRGEAAANLLYSAVELARQTGNDPGLVRALTRLGRLWVARGEAAEQVGRYLAPRGRDLEARGRHLEAGEVQKLMADLLLQTGQEEEAGRLYEQAVRRFRALEATPQAHLALLGLAEVRLAQGDASRALAVFRQASEGGGGQGNEEEALRVLTAICRQFEHERAFAEALAGYLEIRAIRERIGDRQGLIGVLDTLGGLYYQLGEQGKSTQCYQERLQLIAVAGVGSAP